MKRRNKLRTCIHIVWTTKHRTPFIMEAIERRYITNQKRHPVRRTVGGVAAS